ncbi:MAG: ATP-binding protein [Bacteroidales bacterium]|nr:ATP-binding protein [Bacteroidales bacterium]
MKIDRKATKQLIDWKTKKNRKPLVLQGARQVGKTWLMKEFGKAHFSNIAYFNFEEQPDLKQLFEKNRNIPRLIENLSYVNGEPISPEETLIVFDEIQDCPDALNSLKYFYEKSPEYSVICAGSLLGVAMSRGASFPVGKVDFLTIHPITFSEFLSSADHELLDYIENIDELNPIPDIFFNRLLDQFKAYFISGGMPEAVVALIGNKDMNETQTVLQNIIKAYTLDFSKYSSESDFHKINYIWSSLPSQLARDNKKFLYQAVKPGARAREYENALLWLENSGLVHKIYKVEKPALPLSAYRDLSAFKIYLDDVGVLRRLALLNPVAISEGNRLFTEFKGALSENYILQSLVAQFEEIPSYWTSGNMAELDFLLQIENEIIPVEVKSDVNVRSKSLAVYKKKYNPKIAVRYSLRNLKYNDGVLNIPMFMADYSQKLMEYAF